MTTYIFEIAKYQSLLYFRFVLVRMESILLLWFLDRRSFDNIFVAVVEVSGTVLYVQRLQLLDEIVMILHLQIG